MFAGYAAAAGGQLPEHRDHRAVCPVAHRTKLGLKVTFQQHELTLYVTGSREPVPFAHDAQRCPTRVGRLSSS